MRDDWRDFGRYMAEGLTICGFVGAIVLGLIWLACILGLIGE